MASATPCQGRLAIINLPDKDKTPIAFVKRPEDKKPILFSVPKACSGEAAVGTEHLCAACQERAVKTAAAVEKAGGKYVANQQTLLHGRFGEPLPEWSHMFGSRWFIQTQAEKRLEIPEAVAAVTALLTPKSDTQPPVEMPPKRRVAGEPTTQPTEVKPEPKKRAPKKVATKAEAVAVAPQPITAPEPAVAVAPPAAPVDAAPLVPKRKFAPKKKAAAAQPVPEPTLGVIQAQPLEGLQVKKISVRKITIDDRTVYLSAEKDKVYDLKFNYIGRYNRREERIESKYADSDRE